MFLMVKIKKTLAFPVLLLFASALLIAGCGDSTTEKETITPQVTHSAIPEPTTVPTFVDLNGRLSVKGTQLVNEKGEPVQLKGMSSSDIASYGNLATPEMLKYLRDDWGVNVFRIAMYTEDAGGYIRNPKVKDTVKKVVEYAREAGIYVIIDWHILYDKSPLKYQTQAKEFFTEMSGLYKDYPNVIYEICNEPNGREATWKDAIKPYAEEIIPAIRQNDPDSLILVGTPTWSQDVDIAANDPLPYDNIMYVMHFYAGTHGQILKDKVDTALSKGLPIFVTEWGTCEASGDGGIYHVEALAWIKFLDEKNISYVNWSLSTKREAASVLRETVNPRGVITDTDLTESGLFIKYMIKGIKNVVLFADGFEDKTFTQGKWNRVKTAFSQDNVYKGIYCASFSKDCSLERAITTVSYKNLQLTLAYDFVNGQSGDALNVEWFDGTNWNKIEDLAPVNDWTVKTIAMPAGASGIGSFKVRLTSKIAGDDTKILLDEIWMSAEK